MKRLFFSLLVLGITSTLAIGATTAYFTDTTITSGNIITTGSLDLKVDDKDTDVLKFSLSNLKPGSQPRGYYMLKNVGTSTGSLYITDITILDYENNWSELEQSAGDLTSTVGELSKVMNVRIFLDLNSDGWISTGEPVLFNNKVLNLPSLLDLGKTLDSNEEVRVGFIFDWWSTPMDNQAQDDSFIMNLVFKLEQ